MLRLSNCAIQSIHRLVIIAMAIFFQGCTAQQGYSVLAATGTVIGVEISQNPASQTAQAKLGYNRSELAFVPTNRSAGKNAGNTKEGARDTANVLMELRYGGIFDLGPSSGIYQRLAVGDIAVKQNGAAVMFSKNANGDIDQNTVKALRAIKEIPASEPRMEEQKSIISEKYNELKEDPTKRSMFDAAVQTVGYRSYPEFAIDSTTTIEEVIQVRNELKAQGITFQHN